MGSRGKEGSVLRGTVLARQRREGPRLASQAGVARMAFYRNDQMAISAGDVGTRPCSLQSCTPQATV